MPGSKEIRCPTPDTRKRSFRSELALILDTQGKAQFDVRPEDKPNGAGRGANAHNARKYQVNLQSKPHGEQTSREQHDATEMPRNHYSHADRFAAAEISSRPERHPWCGSLCTRVRTNGLRLACDNGANPRIVEYFAFLHDVCRRNDGRGSRSRCSCCTFCTSFAYSLFGP